jgi:hypothetical protein
MSDRRWTDPRDGRAWLVRTYWSGPQAMAVPLDWEPPRGEPVEPSRPLVSFRSENPPEYMSTSNPSERFADEMADEEIQELLDRARPEGSTLMGSRHFPRPDRDLPPANPDRFCAAPDGERYRVWLAPAPRHLREQAGETRMMLTFVDPDGPNVSRWVPAGTVLEEIGDGELGRLLEEG